MLWALLIYSKELYKFILNVTDTLELLVLSLVLPKLPASNNCWSISRLEF